MAAGACCQSARDLAVLRSPSWQRDSSLLPAGWEQLLLTGGAGVWEAAGVLDHSGAGAWGLHPRAPVLTAY